MSKSKLIGIIGACIIVVITVAVIVTRLPAPTHLPSPAGTYALSVSVDPSGAGSVSLSSGEYKSGVQVTLRASPANGYTFDHWSGSASGTGSTLTVTMDSDKHITAHFELEVAPALIDISPEELVAAIYKNDLTSLQREELWKGFLGKRVRWTGTLAQVWSLDDYRGFSAYAIGIEWMFSLEAGSIIARFDDGVVYDEHPYINCRTRIEIHVAFNEGSKASLLGLAKGSVVAFEGIISDDLYMSGGDSICASIATCIHLIDGTLVSEA